MSHDFYKSKGAKNPWACGEVDLWINNTQSLMKNLEAFRDNYKLKIQKGKFNKALAEKGLLIVVKSAITDYNRRFPRETISLCQSDKELVAKELFKQLWDDYGLKSVKSVVPPKATRNFSGQIYKFRKRYKLKSEATKAKTSITKSGKTKCRVFSSKDGYDIYVRGA